MVSPQNRISNGGKKRLVARNATMAYKLTLIFSDFSKGFG
jgi:hypothetical protein